jgi:D-tyrosyl-tRNA(Tyr) deacylase
MRILLQRVVRASVEVDGAVAGAIEGGLLLLVGFQKGDGPKSLRPLAEKIVNLRVFGGEKGGFDRSVLEVGGGVLSVSQFTLFGETRKGRRPDFGAALEASAARILFESWCTLIPELGVKSTASGVFQAHMRVLSVNDGPVTLLLDG